MDAAKRVGRQMERDYSERKGCRDSGEGEGVW